jgi:hypothetical protein
MNRIRRDERESPADPSPRRDRPFDQSHAAREALLAVLRGSTHAILAVDNNTVVGKSATPHGQAPRRPIIGKTVPKYDQPDKAGA